MGPACKSLSNLYGIETVMNVANVFVAVVFIEPLWNWNWRNLHHYPRPWSLYRTFMELKLTQKGQVQKGIKSLYRTFMELKQLLPKVSKEAFLSLSNLYGIETKSVSIELDGRDVFIEPLWNWNKDIRPEFYDYLSLYRTFMELKPVWYGQHYYPPWVFIEPLWNWNYFAMVACLNRMSLYRTFMELKQSCSPLRSPSMSSLSNLYGIETPSSVAIHRWPSVFIEPLWNWNFLELLVNLPSWRSLSNLYGIETQEHYLFSCQGNVFIEPLWNWNWGDSPSLYVVHCLNRTFMELKLLPSNWECRLRSVLIEPLWNWNLVARYPHRCGARS